MSNYNTQLQSNNTDLQTVLQTLQNKATGGQATPEISVSSNGLITATAGTKSSTYQLAFQAAKTITPSTADQVAVSSGYFTGGVVTVKGDSNLVAGNIKSGVSIFGVNGTLEEGSGSSGEDDYDEADNLVTMAMTSYTNSRVSSIGQGAFAFASALKSISFPNVISIGNYAFYNCFSLRAISFPNITSIGGSAFFKCYVLSSLALGASIVCTLSKSNAFSSTPYAGYSTYFSGTPYIYVPASLVDSYKTATNWTYFSSYFSAVENADSSSGETPGSGAPDGGAP